eukprot:12488841-Heterocapsa_arctica.AAC.1
MPHADPSCARCCSQSRSVGTSSAHARYRRFLGPSPLPMSPRANDWHAMIWWVSNAALIESAA